MCKLSLKEVKKPVELRGSEDCYIVDAEDYKADSAFPVPMFVQHTESILEENDQMVVAPTTPFLQAIWYGTFCLLYKCLNFVLVGGTGNGRYSRGACYYRHRQQG